MAIVHLVDFRNLKYFNINHVSCEIILSMKRYTRDFLVNHKQKFFIKLTRVCSNNIMIITLAYGSDDKFEIWPNKTFIP